MWFNASKIFWLCLHLKSSFPYVHNLWTAKCGCGQCLGRLEQLMFRRPLTPNLFTMEADNNMILTHRAYKFLLFSNRLFSMFGKHVGGRGHITSLSRPFSPWRTVRTLRSPQGSNVFVSPSPLLIDFLLLSLALYVQHVTTSPLCCSPFSQYVTSLCSSRRWPVQFLLCHKPLV